MPARLVAFIERKAGLLAGFLAVLVVLLGLAYSVNIGDRVRFLPDEQDYDTLASSLAFQHRYSLDGQNPTAYRAPGYPIFLAFFRFLGARIILFRFLNFVLLSLSLYLVFVILKEQATSLAAALGAVLVLLYPVFFYTAGTLYPQTLASTLFLLVIFLFSRQRIQWRDYLLGGLALGYLILVVPTFAFTLFVFAGWFLLQPRYRSFVGMIAALAAVLLVVGLWTARNLSVFDRFLFVSSNSGENLLMGNSEGTRPNAGTNVDITVYQAQAEGMDEIQRDAFYREKAVEYIQTHPLQSARMYLLKIVNYFNIRNELVTKEEGSPARDLLMLLTYGPLLFIFLIRQVFFRRIPVKPFEILLAVLYLASALANAVFFTRIRFREPFDFLLVLGAAIFLDRVITGLLQSDREPGRKIAGEPFL